jgi:hypothetical protein
MTLAGIQCIQHQRSPGSVQLPVITQQPEYCLQSANPASELPTASRGLLTDLGTALLGANIIFIFPHASCWRLIPAVFKAFLA